MRYLGSFGDGIQFLQFSLERRIVRTRFRGVRISRSGVLMEHGGELGDSISEELSMGEMDGSLHAMRKRRKGGEFSTSSDLSNLSNRRGMWFYSHLNFKVSNALNSPSNKIVNKSSVEIEEKNKSKRSHFAAPYSCGRLEDGSEIRSSSRSNRHD